jgi:ABC-type multidrug transport system fused ATPase/permease subunit
VSYKLSWKPNFSQQSQAIVKTEDLHADADLRSLDTRTYGNIRSLRDLIVAMGRPNLAAIGQILAASLVLQLTSVGSLLLAADTLKENPWLALPWTLGLYLLLRIIHTLLTNATILIGNRMAAEMTGHLTMRLGHHISLLSPHAQKTFSSGNLKTMAITDAQTIGELIHAAASRGIGFLIAPIIAPLILYYLAGWAGIWAFVSMLLMIPFSILSSRRMMRYFDAELKADDSCTTVTGEWLKHQKTARMMEAGAFFAKRIVALKREAFQQARRGMYWAAFIFGAATRWWVVPPVAMIIGAQVMGLNLSMEKVIGSIWYVSLLTAQLMAIPDLIIRGGKAIAALKRLVTLFQEPRLEAALVEDKQGTARGPFESLRLEDVSLSLDGKEILSQISLTIDLSKRTAIVGQLGAGKSTLLALMSGQLFASDGRIILENAWGSHEIRERSAYHLWRHQQVLVGQEAFIETSDIKSNVSFDRTPLTALDDDDLLQSLYDAAMERDIASFRQGIHEPLGETGINLSGGQRQRLSLARALYSKRDFLFLDDPLSAVDEAVADHLWESLLATCQGFVIATHRLKYIETCDQVIVMEGGRITAMAHPRDLIDQGQALFVRLKERMTLGALR